MKLPLTLIHGAEPTQPRRTLGFKGRSELLELWDKLDADKQTLLLELARQMAAADTQPP